MALASRLGGSVPTHFRYTPCIVISSSTGGSASSASGSRSRREAAVRKGATARHWLTNQSAFANRPVTGGPLPTRYTQIWYANRAPTIDGSGQHRSYRGKLGDAYWTRKRLKNIGFRAEFRSQMVEPFLFIGGKLTGWFQSHPRNGFGISGLRGGSWGRSGGKPDQFPANSNAEWHFYRPEIVQNPLEIEFPDESRKFPCSPDSIPCWAAKNSLFGCVGNWAVSD